MVAMGLYQKEQMLICLPRLIFRKEGSDEGVGYLGVVEVETTLR